MEDRTPHEQTPEQQSWIGRLLRVCLTNKLIVGVVVLAAVGAGVVTAPFDWDLGIVPRAPVPTDAIPDIGENQQVVFTRWPGRSPQDVQDQVTYPLTVALLGVPGVKTIRSTSMFGFSTVYVIFKEHVEFYWSRARVLEKLNALPAGTLPAGVRPALGPDATALGQIYWYTLEGRDQSGRPVGGWDPGELRTIQDWTVRHALQAADGVAEVASVGGFVREYQIDVDPDAMRAYGVTLTEVYDAVRASNIDVGAKTIEINRTEYFVRSVGFIRDVTDIENSVVRVRQNVPVLVKHVAGVALGPALRRGALDKDGAEAVGGVVVARYGDNPMAVIQNVKDKIRKIGPGLPRKVLIDDTKVTPDQVRQYAARQGFEAYDEDGSLNRDKWLEHLKPLRPGDWPEWVRTSAVTIVPFYDRAGLIHETLGTLSAALGQEILITLIVVVLMVMHLRSSVLICGMLPVTVLGVFVAMKLSGVDANIVALSGIAIAIGTIVDMGIVLCENILRHLDTAAPEAPRIEVVHRAASEVGSAVLTAVATTVIGFAPVFFMSGAEGKLFKPLAFTKTFALLASIVIALTVLPPAAHLLFCGRVRGRKLRAGVFGALAVAGALLIRWGASGGSGMIVAAGAALGLFAAFKLFEGLLPGRVRRAAPIVANIIVVVLVALLLARFWEPLGPDSGPVANVLFVGGLVGVLLGLFRAFQWAYPWMLQVCLRHKIVFLLMVAAVLGFGATVWFGAETVLSPLAMTGDRVRSSTFWVRGKKVFPGLSKEFMPDLDEGAFLYMPTTMVHASIGEAADIVAKQDMAFRAIPEIDAVVGKLGRAETPLDPAPISMIETVVNYKSEYKTDRNGRRIRFRYDASAAAFARDADGRLIPDPDGRPFRQWRPHIRTADDIWREVVAAGKIPGTTSAPKLQPIKARIVMLQSGMRAPMGVKLQGPSLEAIERAGLRIERLLKEVPGVEPATVSADRIVGKPYVRIVPDRAALARYGVKMRRFQDIVEIAIGGRSVTQTVEGRARFAVRIRYPRELRDRIERIERILVPTQGGAQIPLTQVADVDYVRGPQAIKSEGTSLVGYVLFDMEPGESEVDVVQRCRRTLDDKIRNGQLVLPDGVTHEFAGNYENQIRGQRTLAIVLPVALLLILLILYMQFRSLSTSILVFFGIFVAWAGGFGLIWLYGQSWFLDFSVLGTNMRELFQVHTINLSVAVWVGFLALFGIASDNGVIQSTYLDQVFRDREPGSIAEIREATVIAARRRVRPCLMTSATTILALIPVLTSTGRGSDVMVPMAIPSFGGMLVVLISVFFVPVVYCWIRELRLRKTDGA